MILPLCAASSIWHPSTRCATRTRRLICCSLRHIGSAHRTARYTRVIIGVVRCICSHLICMLILCLLEAHLLGCSQEVTYMHSRNRRMKYSSSGGGTLHGLT